MNKGVLESSKTEYFTDSTGIRHALMPGLAGSLFRRDQPMFAAQSGYSTINSDYMSGVRSRVWLGHRLVRSCGGNCSEPAGRPSILVIGAGDGAECVWLHALEGADVTGIDLGTDGLIAPHLWNFDCGPESDGEIDPGRVRLIQGDIAKCDLPDRSFDVIYSWQTFEHIMDPGAAMRSMDRLLRPGGLAYIEYNPFYSIDGAHWAGTIDLPWAHVRLSPDDFERAIHTLNPDRPAWSARFVRDRINRMTHEDLLGFARDAGLTIEAFLPRVRTEDVLLLDPEIIEAVRCADPRPTLCDLTSRMVRTVLRKP